ncbi:hypothetical protein Ahy_B06g081626 [Arachis hypogaea]|uniref:Transposase MuDR plant domain-containing protein n=1 Tax=Arachis hypogaea TaxID=3818 RepID=A0A444YLK8_ARAHY|nr:hypothetical protein Ahy_B06g081626 [Arachis hypogaea]
MDENDIIIEPDVVNMINALASHLFGEPSFIHALDLDTMNAPKFSEYVNADPVVMDGEFVVDIAGMGIHPKDYIMRKSVDYRVCESEPTTSYAKCVQYRISCNWLIRDSLIKRTWYNGSHTYTKTTISQYHTKLNSDMIIEVIKSLVEGLKQIHL